MRTRYRPPYFRRHENLIIQVLDGSLAQSVEQLTFNQLVAGSNPARPTIFSCYTLAAKIPGRLAQLGEHLPYKEGVTGSNPVSHTTSFVKRKSLTEMFIE